MLGNDTCIQKKPLWTRTIRLQHFSMEWGQSLWFHHGRTLWMINRPSLGSMLQGEVFTLLLTINVQLLLLLKQQTSLYELVWWYEPYLSGLLLCFPLTAISLERDLLSVKEKSIGQTCYWCLKGIHWSSCKTVSLDLEHPRDQLLPARKKEGRHLKTMACCRKLSAGMWTIHICRNGDILLQLVISSPLNVNTLNMKINMILLFFYYFSVFPKIIIKLSVVVDYPGWTDQGQRNVVHWVSEWIFCIDYHTE